MIAAGSKSTKPTIKSKEVEYSKNEVKDISCQTKNSDLSLGPKLQRVGRRLSNKNVLHPFRNLKWDIYGDSMFVSAALVISAPKIDTPSGFACLFVRISLAACFFLLRLWICALRKVFWAGAETLQNRYITDSRLFLSLYFIIKNRDLAYRRFRAIDIVFCIFSVSR